MGYNADADRKRWNELHKEMKLEFESGGCDECDIVKKAFILLNKMGITGIAIMCTNCNTIWEIK